MATATKQRRKAKQKTFEQTKDLAGGVEELDQIGSELLRVASERGRLGEQLKGLKASMADQMKKHKKRVYKVDDATFEFHDEEKLLVKRPKEKESTSTEGSSNADDDGDED